MPRFDGMGPMGQGPMTGRGLGPCGGCRCGGAGYGLGARRFVSPKNELAALEDEEKTLENELAIIREEKSSLEKTEK